MAKIKSTKRTLLMSILSLVMCVSMFVGSTFAWFTDTVTSSSNVIKAGNLDIEVKYTLDGETWKDLNGANDLFQKGLWEPGHTEVVALKVSNEGSLALKYSVNMNIVEEIVGKTKDGKDIKLSDILTVSSFGGIELAGADPVLGWDIAAMTLDAAFKSENGIAYGEAVAFNKGNVLTYDQQLYPESSQYVFLKIDMADTVGNEANHDGVNIPSINFGINVLATQYTSEYDTFGNKYDETATYPDAPVLNKPVSGTFAEGESAIELKVVDAEQTTVGVVNVPASAVEDTNSGVEININKVNYKANIVIGDGLDSQAFDVQVSGLKEDNEEAIKVKLLIEAGLDPATVSVYHYDEKIESTYDAATGYVTFESATFSPFTVVFEAKEEAESTGLPQANVVNSPQYTNTELPWESYGQWSPTAGLEANLEAAYTFSCEETVEQAEKSPYADWYCDFYVKLDKDLGENEIFLGGNYGSFGWIGFHNGDFTLEANEEIGLLSSVTTKPWTYLDVVKNVGTFICGVGDVDNALTGATFTVMLRLTNPEDATEFVNIETINYKFSEQSSLPQANVVASPEYVNTDLPWGSYGAWSPTEGLDSKLEAAYTFTCTETLEEAKANPYANWHCDFYVKLDKDLGENEIFLGGNYGSFGWVGFHNGDLTLEANTEIGLLSSVTTNPWTYVDVAQNVGTFICGVGDVNDALKGATFTVMLRLTNPEDSNDYVNVATTTHTFN